MPERVLLASTDPRGFALAVEALRAGRVVAFPTDTVYGLGAHSGMATAIKRLFAIKGRERQKAIPLLLSSTDQVVDVAREVPPIAWHLAERFWPGAVTLVLPRAYSVLDVITAGADSIAVRVPAHDVALRLISELEVPIAATSANLSGQPEAATAQEVLNALGTRVRLVLDGGRCPGGVASTVVDLTTEPPTIRRRGMLADEVEAFLQQIL
jgi:L-threonylcarbamoyladenylate synthase